METTENTPTVFTFGTANLVAVTDETGQSWFRANEICEILGYANPRQAVKKNCKPKGVSTRDTLTEGGLQSATYISEGNLYRLIIKSKKPDAEAFEDWVMEEVLPSIRKTGGYYMTLKRDKPRPSGRGRIARAPGPTRCRLSRSVLVSSGQAASEALPSRHHQPFSSVLPTGE